MATKNITDVRSWNKKYVFIFVAGFALTGAYILQRSFAASPLVSFEAESATVTSPATIGTNDTTASGVKYLQFGSSSTVTPPPPPPSTSPTSLTTPIRAAFYYPWFPETWTVNGAHVKYNPLLGYYDSSVQANVDSHIKSLDYANVDVAIASWWGIDTHQEATRIPLLLQRTQALGAKVKWAFYYEQEGFGDPTVSQIQSELDYIKTKYASNSSYAYVNGKPVIFVYNAGANDNTCAIADKWKQASATSNFYVVLKVFTNYKTCATQPDSWHQYAPSSPTDSQAGYSYAISPGFWRADEAAPRLARDPTRWTQNVNDMVASNAPWQLVTTFSEWGEGTAIENAQEWNSASGYGTYLDALHNKP